MQTIQKPEPLSASLGRVRDNWAPIEMREHAHVRIQGGRLRDGGASVSALQRPIAALLLLLWSALIASGPASAQEPAAPATLEPIPGAWCKLYMHAYNSIVVLILVQDELAESRVSSPCRS